MDSFETQYPPTERVKARANTFSNPSFTKKKSNSIDESSKYEDHEESIEVDWEGEIVSALEELKKSRRSNKALKDQLAKAEELLKHTKDMQEVLERRMNDKEKELGKQLDYTKDKIKELEENKVVLEESMKESEAKNELLI